MSNLTQNYEISVWSILAQKETKLGIIGGNDMLTPARAQAPQLKRNINGTKTLTFSLYTKYIDEIDGEKKVNPFCNLIHNESRIKLKWKNKWYEFIVKSIIEDSENNKNTYIAEDAFITELSRKGFDIELSTELENNQGTIIELENKILENSDWQLDEENSVVGPQLKEDTLVKLITIDKITATECCEIDNNGKLQIIKKNFVIPKDSTIYAFYSSLYKKDSFFQFYYNTTYKFGDDGFIVDCPIYSVDKYKYNDDLPNNTKDYELTTYKGKQLVRTQKIVYNKILDKYVSLYQDSSKNEIGCFTETEIVTDDFVSNLATNGSDFTSDLGWYSIGNNSTVEFYSYPSAEEVLQSIKKNKTITSKSYIKISDITATNNIFYNSGFEDSKSLIKTLYNGQKFVIRLKYKYKKKDEDDKKVEPLKEIETTKKGTQLTNGFKVSVCEYEFDDNGEPKITDVLFETSLDEKTENGFKKDVDDSSFWTAICTCKDKYTKSELLEANIGLFFSYEISDNSKTIKKSNLKNYEFCIENFEFFEYKEKIIDDENSKRDYYLLGETPSGEIRIKYNYFKTEQEYEDADDIEYEYQGYTEKNYGKKFVENYQQIRSITEKESNIFNLTQSLCETFEVWADFVVEHDDLGYILKDSNGNFIKKIVFKPFVGKENWSGFHYKTNLKSIQRTTESKQITTKTIVKTNSNEFAPNGFCTIAYSEENPSGEAFIYDFRYYENQNLIDAAKLTEELQGTKGLYTKLKSINNKITKKTEDLLCSSNKLLKLEADREILIAKEAELATSIATNKKSFKTLTGYSYKNFSSLSQDKINENFEIDGVSGLFLVIYNESNELKEIKKQVSQIKKDYKSEKTTYNQLVSNNAEFKRQKEELILSFETKYAPFIQEGTWIDESYIDHNLYYIDAKSIAATSALPQVTYSIDVLDLSGLEEFKNYDIDLGDKTYITDPEFFGYINTGAFRTPRRQEVIISEMTEELEEPEKNKIVVQNFKTQFDDIFHRITATTQQLKLNEGAYQRASGAFNNYGLDSNIAQNAFNSTNFVLKNNTNTWDTQGFLSAGSNGKYLLKVHDGAIMTSSDGNWNKIIDARGINADYIYAGQLDAGKINIVSELKVNENQDLEYAVTFDKDGLSMYDYSGSKKTRLRLGKILEEDKITELYGLQLYNSSGEQTFKTDSDGNISITGEIRAGSGLIGGWGIEGDRLVHYNDYNLIDAMIATEKGDSYSVNGYSNDNWRFLLGIDGSNANFGVTANGNLFANGVDIKDGNISIGDLFKITSNGGNGQAMSYGLNIKLNPENQNEEIVIESDDRVIGIRERNKNGIGWTWKTILGDLTNATLGGKPLSDYGLSGYGLCTENGLFSGTIIASSGQIGGWKITENTLVREVKGENDELKKALYLGVSGEDEEKLEYFVFEGSEITETTTILEKKELSFTVPTDKPNDITILEDISINSSLVDSNFAIEIISLKQNEQTISHLVNLDSLSENHLAIKVDKINNKIKISFINISFIDGFEPDDVIKMTININAITTKILTYKHKYSDGRKIPDDFSFPETVKPSFQKYIFYKLYNRYPEINMSDNLIMTIKILPQVLEFLVLASAIEQSIIGNECFTRFYTDDEIIYAIDYKGRTKGKLEPRNFIINDEQKNYKSVFSNLSPGFFEIISNSTYNTELKDIINIRNGSGGTLWKLGIESFNKTQIETETENFIIGNLVTTDTTDKLGVWKFQVNSDNDTYSFFFDNSSNGENTKDLAYCALGAEEYPWSHLYTQKLSIRRKIDNNFETTKLYFEAGDTFEVSNSTSFSGYTTDSSMDIFVFIPTNKPILPDVKSVKVTGEIAIRGPEKWCCDPNDSSNVKINLTSPQGFICYPGIRTNGVSLRLTRQESNGGDGKAWVKEKSTTTYPTNVPLSVVGYSLKFTFSN